MRKLGLILLLLIAVIGCEQNLDSMVKHAAHNPDMEHIDNIQSKYPDVDAYGEVMAYAVKHNVIEFLETDAIVVEWKARKSRIDRGILELAILTQKQAEISKSQHLVDENEAAIVDRMVEDIVNDYLPDWEQWRSIRESFVSNDKEWGLVYDNLNDTELHTREFSDRTEYKYIFSDDSIAYRRYTKQE